VNLVLYTVYVIQTTTKI